MPNHLIHRAAALGLLAASVTATPAHAVESFDACTGYITSLPATLTSQGTWCLNKDINTAQTTGQAILVAANNVSIDCNGFKIGGLAAGPATAAVGVRSGALNTSVLGCNVRGFQYGVVVEGGYGARIEGNTFDSNRLVGIYVQGSGHVVRDNRVVNHGGGDFQVTGIQVMGTTQVLGNTIRGVTGGGAIGVEVTQSAGGSVSGNVITGLSAGESGPVYGMFLGEGALSVTDNRLRVAPGNGSAMFCGGAGQVVRDNSGIGFGFPLLGCEDGGGNVFKP